MNRSFEIVLATRNPGKVDEMRALLGDLDVEVRSALDEPDGPEVDEDRPTLEGNALKKARAWNEHTGRAALADDTGLEVEALDGRPGVYSARYAGADATDRDNRRRLLADLEGEAVRTARFRTVVAFVDGDTEQRFEGICAGHIIEEERGTGGFGYDSVFVPDGETRTFAELSAGEKNRISHRGKALRAFAAYLRTKLSRDR